VPYEPKSALQERKLKRERGFGEATLSGNVPNEFQGRGAARRGGGCRPLQREMREGGVHCLEPRGKLVSKQKPPRSVGSNITNEEKKTKINP